MAENLFGTDGIRGTAGVYPLDIEGVIGIGRAVGECLGESGETILIGHDTRESSPLLAAAVSVGVLSSGNDPAILGVAPTAAVSYATKRSGASAGVMITASHNPYRDNGIKIFHRSGDKLSDGAQANISRLATTFSGEGYGTSRNPGGAIEHYRRLIIQEAGAALDGMALGLDAANGAGYELAPSLLELVGVTVYPLAVTPNGRNINEDCGTLHAENLQAAVRKHGLDGGIALDGDADRVIMVDEYGRQLSGDHLLYINAVMGKYAGIVATKMSNIGLERGLAGHDIELHRTDVGDRAVIAAMRKRGLTLGGEQSGHVIFSDLMPTGDGLLAAIQTLKSVRASEKTLGEWHDELHLLPQKIVSVPVFDKQAVIQSKLVGELVDDIRQKLGGDGRIDVRPSGTEPVIRVMVESEDAETMADMVAQQIRELFGEA